MQSKQKSGQESPDQPLKRHSKRRSLKWTIGLLYMMLAVVNIIFFSVMIFENQTDLLMNTFKYQSANLVNEVLGHLQELELSKEKDDSYRLLTRRLSDYELRFFVVFDGKGGIWHKEKGKSGEEPLSGIPKRLLQKTAEFSAQQAMFRSRFNMELNEKDYSIDLLIPMKSRSGEQIFLYAPINISSMQDRLRDMYKQIALSVSWGVIFHVLFAVFLFRVIFRRISILQTTSERMTEGELGARASWRQSRSDDELDELGLAFNTMAESIQEKVETISRLNQEIQQELMIGKEVQELFLGDLSVYKDHKLSLYYRPLREVSGDVYKFYEMRNGLRGLFFADASGHGVSAALITTITLMSLDEILRTTLHPGKIFSRLNDMLAMRLDTSYFATGVFFLMDRSGSVYFSNAGHNPIICLRPSSGETIELTKMGPPLGLMEDFEYPTKKLAVKPGDKLLVYSDGLVETPNEADEQYGLDRAVAHFQENSDKSPEQITEILKRDFTEFAAHYKDDVTIMVLEIP